MKSQLDKSWRTAKELYHHPVLKPARLIPKHDGGACFDFKTQETLIGEEFVHEIHKETCLPIADILTGLGVHEIGHYMVFPRTLATAIFTHHLARTQFPDEGEEFHNVIIQMYGDMCTDVKSVLEGGGQRDDEDEEKGRAEYILDMRTASQKTIPDELNYNIRAVMLGVLRHQAGMDHGLDDELVPFFEKMLRVNFLHEPIKPEPSEPGKKQGRPMSKFQILRLNIFNFGTVLLDMIEKYGGGKGSGGIPVPGGCPVSPGDHSDCHIKELLGNATPTDVKIAIRELSDNLGTIGELNKIKEWLKDQGVQAPDAPSPFSIGVSSGERPVDIEVLDYYKELSKRYPLVVTRKLLDTNDNARVWSDTEKWRPGNDPNLILPSSSGGKVLVGITRNINISEVPIRSRDYKVPHLLVVIDSSGSMPDPKTRKSFSVLGAYCAARSRHVQEAHIGVVNFSGDSFYLPYTRELDDAFGAISAFQGGGTVPDLDMIRKMLGPEMAELYAKNPDLSLSQLPPPCVKKEVNLGLAPEVFDAESIDVLMFTDGGIFNVEEVLALFEERAEVNRATIVLSHGASADVGAFAGGKINVVQVESNEDIPYIVIADTTQGFNALRLV